MSEIKLKPCPLCGRKKLTVKTNRHVSHVTCESCNLTLTRETEKEAIQYWNKRVVCGMSNDLISRKELIKKLEKWCGKQRYLIPEEVWKLIETEPTAFDKEKVIQELRELKMMYFLTIANTGDEKLDCAYENTGNALDKAVEIVEKSGIE